ncbi:phage tail assembly protein T [Salmonella enterica subsp. enterica]|nr:phage tail assembly protein T [Salmonella enterica subsp. enterica serovar Newport]ECA9705925.1 phage tail assembly protein T [Salmonella enterica subsp. enterica serovar Bredeney]EDE8444793.1 phage tail assembly protein T [Salmonella enterica subsp. enterica serovar Pomona]EDU8805032.1 phage tail assembly protein T [Salmonella enterica subsp. enterica]HCK3132178.1 phage tail assembly protein T [Salmonella enterica subsp. enterica serovar Ruiru]
MTFVKHLAREFGRPDWRRMLASMSCTELVEWMEYYTSTPFSDVLLDAEFAQLNTTIVSLVSADAHVSPADFMLLSPVVTDEEQSDEKIMLVAEGITGGVRYGVG